MSAHMSDTSSQFITRRLQGGSITLDLVGPDLFDLTYNGTQIAQRVYVAVRDEVWNTIPGSISDLRVVEDPDSFVVTFIMSHQFQDVDFSWQGTITGTADSTVVFEMNGEANSAFSYAKIGLNIHHRLREHLGRSFYIGEGNKETTGQFPHAIDPQLEQDGVLSALCAPYDTLRCDLPDGKMVTFSFQGDLFEAQDHRNWADANFKSYGTPMIAGWPRDAHPGTIIHQSVTIMPSTDPPNLLASAKRSEPNTPVSIDVTPRKATGRLPDIGHSLTSADHTLDDIAFARLAQLSPSHLRVGVSIGDGQEQSFFEQLRACTRSSLPVELAVWANTDESPDALDDVQRAVLNSGADVRRVLAFTKAPGYRDAGCTPAEIINQVGQRIVSPLGSVPLVGGTDQFFAEIARTPPITEGLDGINFALNPQVHAADNRSLMDNVVAVQHFGDSIRELCAGLPIHISPVSLIGPHGPHPAGPPPADDPFAGLDQRQAEQFCAAWTVGFLTNAAQANIASITMFDVAGACGLFADRSPASLAIAPAFDPGTAFPAFHVLADLAHWTDRNVLDASAPEEERIFALLQTPADAPRRLLLTNGNDEPRWITLTGIDAEIIRMRTLDSSTVAWAGSMPEQFGASLTERRAAYDGAVTLALAPHAVVRAEWDSTT